MGEPERTTTPPRRVVSLLGAATETVYRLGLGHVLVGRSHECDHPRAVLSLPCVSRPRIDVDAPSRDIDAAVRSHSEGGEPVYKLDGAELSKLRPDLIIVQSHCRVCSVTPEDIALAERGAEIGGDGCPRIPQLIVRPATLRDCLNDVRAVADALGVPERGATLLRTLEWRLDRVREVVAEARAGRTSGGAAKGSNGPRPRVALLEWCDPIMGCGYWLPELVDVAGGEALHCPPPGGGTPSISFEALLESEPNVVVFALCGFGLTRAASEIRSSWGDENIDRLKAKVGGSAIFVVDGNYLINRSGPRLVESAEALAEAIHPDLQGHFGHLGSEMLATLDDAMVLADAGVWTGSRKEGRLTPFEESDSKSERGGGESEDRNNGGGAVAEATTARRNPPRVSPGEAVEAQLRCLGNDRILEAFAMNSTANQARWCTPDRFEGVLRGHESFRRLLSEPAFVGLVEERGDTAVVHVSLPERMEGDDGGITLRSVELLWTMVIERAEGAASGACDVSLIWRTEKVGFAS